MAKNPITQIEVLLTKLRDDKRWIEDKNRRGANIPIEAAYPIAKMIGEEGIKVPNDHNPGGVVSDVLNPARVLSLQNDIITIIRYAIIDTLKID